MFGPRVPAGSAPARRRPAIHDRGPLVSTQVQGREPLFSLEQPAGLSPGKFSAAQLVVQPPFRLEPVPPHGPRGHA
jgi:hypothetical protein